MWIHIHTHTHTHTDQAQAPRGAEILGLNPKRYLNPKL
jgi:hypothetical protein